MEGLTVLVIIAILIGYLNLWLIIKKEKPNIIINNNLPKDLFKYEALPADKNAMYKFNIDHSSTTEIPIETNTTVKTLQGSVNLDNEKLEISDISELTNKIKNFRSK